ncbi:hypothetical protein [Roseibium album]|uniref:hypothetical protein n=1 Tax=Roseibium album TaxID=311410 RepID=UPI003BB1753F
MALQASGSLSSTDILTELNLPAGTSISSADTRIKHLANKPTGSISSSDFYSRLPIRLVDQVTAGPLGLVTTHTFSSVDFGPAFTGRVLFACIAISAENGASILDQQTCTIAGNSAVGDDAGARTTQTNPDHALGAGLWYLSDEVNTSGDVVINWTSNSADYISLFLLAADVLGLPFDDDTTNWFPPGPSFIATSIAQTIDIPADGFLIASQAQSANETTTFTNATKRHSQAFGNAMHNVAYDNKLASQTGRTITASWTTSRCAGGEARSFSEA